MKSARARIAGLTTAVDIADRRARHEALVDRTAHRSSLAGMTLRTVLEDLGEVIDGLPRDFSAEGPRVSFYQLLARNDRLRGLGLALLVVAFIMASVA